MRFWPVGRDQIVFQVKGRSGGPHSVREPLPQGPERMVLETDHPAHVAERPAKHRLAAHGKEHFRHRVEHTDPAFTVERDDAGLDAVQQAAQVVQDLVILASRASGPDAEERRRPCAPAAGRPEPVSYCRADRSGDDPQILLLIDLRFIFCPLQARAARR